MLRTICNGRTVWVKDIVTEKRQGPNGEFEAKSILFRIATDRNYTRTVMKDGQQVEERPTDFILCRANGNTAQIIKDNCTAVDPATGKTISRHLGLIGHIETFVSDRTFKVENLPLNIDNVGTVNVSFDTTQKVDGHIFIVDEIEFLDPKPQPKVQAGTATVSNVQVTTAQAVPTQTQAEVPATPAPMQAQAVVPETSVQTTASTPQSVVEGAMNPPIVPEGYTGATSPF